MCCVLCDGGQQEHWLLSRAHRNDACTEHDCSLCCMFVESTREKREQEAEQIDEALLEQQHKALLAKGLQINSDALWVEPHITACTTWPCCTDMCLSIQNRSSIDRMMHTHSKCIGASTLITWCQISPTCKASYHTSLSWIEN